MVTFGHHPEDINFFTFTKHKITRVPLQDGKNRFFLYWPSMDLETPKVGTKKVYPPTEEILSHHPEHIFKKQNFSSEINPSSPTWHKQNLLKCLRVRDELASILL